jgi:type VII secretion integral membrane protein EccD
VSATVGEVSRVTIVAPKTRMDLAIPSDVPLADLLPTLLRYAGEELADEGAAKGGWTLRRLGGPTLDNSRTPSQLEIRDGEVLYFTPRNSPTPEVVFDDVVDAVATATRDRAGKWTTLSTQRFSLLFAVAALLGGAAAVLFAGPPQLTAGITGLAIGFVLLVIATVVSRAGGDSRTGTLVAMVALAYATVGGLLLLAGDRTVSDLAAPHVLLAATALILFSAAATIGVGASGPVFVGAAAAGAALGVAAGISLAFDADAVVGAAVAGTVAFSVVPALPMLAYRLARLPVPSLPAGPEDLKSDTETVNGSRILALSNHADRFFTGLLWTVAVIVFGAEVVLALHGTLNSLLLCTVLALLLLLRARPLVSWQQRTGVLAMGTLGLGLVATIVFQHGNSLVRLVAVPAILLAAATVSLVYGLLIAGKRISPLWGRTLDIIEILLIVAVVPLAAWVCGLYDWIINIRP